MDRVIREVSDGMVPDSPPWQGGTPGFERVCHCMASGAASFSPGQEDSRQGYLTPDPMWRAVWYRMAIKKLELKSREMRLDYSVLNEWPHEHDFVTFGLFILNPEPIKLSM